MRLLALLLLGFSLNAFATCKDDNWDVYKVTKARMQGADKEMFLRHVNAAPDIDEQRKEHVRKLVDEVFDLPQEAAESYRETHFIVCSDS